MHVPCYFPQLVVNAVSYLPRRERNKIGDLWEPGKNDNEPSPFWIRGWSLLQSAPSAFSRLTPIDWVRTCPQLAFMANGNPDPKAVQRETKGSAFGAHSGSQLSLLARHGACLWGTPRPFPGLRHRVIRLPSPGHLHWHPEVPRVEAHSGNWANKSFPRRRQRLKRCIQK